MRKPGQTDRALRWAQSHVLHIIFSCAIWVLIVACGAGFGLPNPTTKNPSVKDISGIYTYPIKRCINIQCKNETATLYLNADHTFEIKNGLAATGSGMWELEETKVVFNYQQSQMYEGSAHLGWYVIDASEKDFTIMGGETGDPDSWQPMTKIAPPQ